MIRNRPLSWWERDAWLGNIDLVVIGSGIVGLNAAWQYRLKNPGAHVIVLERGLLPTGASTRNAGFACFGSVSELLYDISVSGEEKTFSLVKERWEGLQLLRKKLGDETIGFENNGGYEIFIPGQQELYEKCIAALPHFNRIMADITGLKATYLEADETISRFGFAKTEHIITCPAESQIHSGKMMLALLQAATAAGVQVITGADVRSMDIRPGSVALELDEGMEITSRKLIIANNAFLPQLLPGYDIKPARGQVLVTHPIPGLKLRGIYHYDEGYYYFRNIGDRLLLGGGRNLDFTGEETYEMQVSEKIQHALEKLISEVILPGQKVEVDMRWAGIMAMGKEKYYILKNIQPHVVVAARLSGMGVALGSKVGADAAALLD